MARNKKTEHEARRVAQMIADECIAFRVRRLNRLVTRLYDEALRPNGLKIAQLILLVGIERSAPVQPSVLGAALEIEKSTLSRNLRLLLNARWIRVSHAKGKRGRLLELTWSGKTLLKQAAPAWKAGQKRTQEMLGPQARATLDAMAKSLRAT